MLKCWIFLKWLPLAALHKCRFYWYQKCSIWFSLIRSFDLCQSNKKNIHEVAHFMYFNVWEDFFMLLSFDREEKSIRMHMMNCFHWKFSNYHAWLTELSRMVDFRATQYWKWNHTLHLLCARNYVVHTNIPTVGDTPSSSRAFIMRLIAEFGFHLIVNSLLDKKYCVRKMNDNARIWFLELKFNWIMAMAHLNLSCWKIASERNEREKIQLSAYCSKSFGSHLAQWPMTLNIMMRSEQQRRRCYKFSITFISRVDINILNGFILFLLYHLHWTKHSNVELNTKSRQANVDSHKEKRISATTTTRREQKKTTAKTYNIKWNYDNS